MPEIDYHFVKRALLGPEDECGDGGVIKQYDGECFLALIDALGHGKEAHEIAVLAENFLLKNFHEKLIGLMNGLHSCLKGTRGAVAALCRLNLSDGQMHYVSVGNITTRLFGSTNSRMVPRGGVIGYMMTAPKEQTIRLYHGDILYLSSDGIKEHFDPNDFPGLLTGSARQIADAVLNGFSKNTDDASCIILRYLK
ncbi:MAG: SpoIIE family protein phosphatase [Deltaproteobacteria bacterium]|nr:SpoIIE family protein phosphatase [Deltaproteobacteria bacterium]